MTTLKVHINGFYRGDVSIGQTRHGISMFCARCGEVWARMESDLQNAATPHYHLHFRMCPKHGVGLLFPRSVLVDPSLRGERALIRAEFLKLADLWLEHGHKTYTFLLPENLL